MLKKLKSIDIYLLLVLIPAIFLRLWNLGYSDYQGDEIRALYSPIQGESFINFILRQRKGPVQYCVTYLVKLVDPKYTDYFIDRLPFALAGIVSIVFFYLFVKNIYNKRTAFLAAFLLTVNGFFVALSRIVQYQGIVFMFTFLALYLYSVAIQRNDKTGFKYIFWGTVSWGFSMLAHYDGVFIAPFLLYLGILWLVRSKLSWLKKILMGSVSVITALFMLLIFYFPMYFYLSDETKSYWTARVTGTMSDKSASSINLFKVYQPLFAHDFYAVILAISLLVLFISIINIIFNLNLVTKIKNKIVVNALTKINKCFTVQQPLSFIVLFSWTLAPMIFMEKLVTIPGTHIYTYLEPIIIIIAVTIDFLISKFALNKVVKNVMGASLGIIFVLLTYQSYKIFIDNKYEYPWTATKILNTTIEPPDHNKYNLSLFGFPYNRSWRSISEFVKQYPEIKAYTSNENNAISNYYTELTKSTEKAGFYIFIKDPQTFKRETNNQKYLYWAANNSPVFSVSKNGEGMANVYIMPVGTYEEISRITIKK